MPKRTRVPATESIGKRFGRLLVLSITKAPNAIANCVCDCGMSYSPTVNNLRLGLILSCGCLRRDRAKTRFTKHGHCSNGPSREYRVWQMMKDRCHNPKNKDFRFYGARGIKVCGRWRNSFDAFISDVGPRPTPKHQIERLNNNKHYTPGNTAWKTKIEQANNTRGNRRIEYDGQTKTLSEWSRFTGLEAATIRTRIDRYGYSIPEALTTPVKRQP